MLRISNGGPKGCFMNFLFHVNRQWFVKFSSRNSSILKYLFDFGLIFLLVR